MVSGDDAALVRPPTSESGANLLLVHTLDYFRSFISDPYMFGRVAAVHALSGNTHRLHNSYYQYYLEIVTLVVVL